MTNPIIIWLSTLIIYLAYFLFGSTFLTNLFCTVAIISFLLYFLFFHRPSFPSKLDHWLTLLTIVLLLSAQFVALYPYINQPVENNQQFIGFSGIGDYFKHSYVITTLAENGLDAKHPFFPISDFKYYYGYYLIPTLITTFFRNWQLFVLTCFVLFTTAFGYLLIKKVIDENINNPKLRWLAYSLSIVGYSFDLLSMLVGKFHLSMPWYEAWKIDSLSSFRVMTTFRTGLWVPQHFLVGCLVVYLISRLLGKKETPIYQIFGVVFFSLLSSVFVSIYLAFALGLIFLFFPKHRKNLLIGGSLAMVVLLPYITSVFGSGTKLFSFYSVNPYHYFAPGTFLSGPLNWFIAVFSQIGWLPLLAFVTLLLLRKKIENKQLLFWGLLIFPFMIITLFVRSSGFNDFAMRSMLPIQIGLPIILGIAVEKLEWNWKKYSIIGLMILSVIVSAPGLLSEPLIAWKQRGLLSFDESRLMLHIRTIPNQIRLAAVGRDEWIYKIPSMGFHSVLTDNLYDAAPYSDPKINHTEVEVGLRELFLDPSSDIQNKTPQELVTILAPLPFDQLIVDENIYVKQGKNPWSVIFDTYNVPVQTQVGRFRFYDKTTLISQMSNRLITLGESKVIKAKDKTFPIGKGLWFIQVCNEASSTKFFTLDLEDYYTVLAIELDKNLCSGNYFYNTSNSPVRLSVKNNVEKINLSPVILK